MNNVPLEPIVTAGGLAVLFLVVVLVVFVACELRYRWINRRKK